MISNRQTEESNKMDFSEQISSEKGRLSKERDEAAQLLAKTTERLQTLERQLEAIDAYAKNHGVRERKRSRDGEDAGIPAERRRFARRFKIRRKALAARESSKRSIAKATRQPSKL